MVDPTAALPVARRSLPFLGWALLLGAVALVLRVAFVLMVDPKVPAIGDASAYHLLANNLADGRGYIRPFDLLKFGRVVATAEYPPLFPAVLSIVARLGIRSVQGQRLVMAILGSGTVVLVAYLGRRVGGRAVGIVAGTLAAAYPMLALPDTILMTETLFAFLVVASLLLAYQADRAPTPLRCALLGLVLGFAALTRAEAMVLAVLLVVPLAWRMRDASVWRRLGLSALVLAVAGAVVLPWSIRNYRTFHAFVPVSNSLVQIVDGANCRLTYSGPALGSWRSTFGTADANRGECFEGFNGSEPGFDEAEAADRSRRDGLAYVRDHASSLPKVIAARELRTFGAFRPWQQTELEALEGRPLAWERVGTVLYWILAPLAIAGLVLLVRRQIPVWPLGATIASVVVSSALTYGTQRFRITAEPAVVVLAAVTIVGASRRLRPAARTAGTG